MIDGSHSSQYTSAVLLAAPYAKRDVELGFLDGALVSRPYVDITLQIMRAFGAEADWTGDEADPRIHVKAGKRYRARRYAIEPDASSAAYPFCAAAIAGGSVRVEGVPPDSLQSDWQILDTARAHGLHGRRVGAARCEVRGSARPLRSLGEVDMNDMPDAVLAYAVVALFADGPTLIKNVCEPAHQGDRSARAPSRRSSASSEPAPRPSATRSTSNPGRCTAPRSTPTTITAWRCPSRWRGCGYRAC